MTNLTHFTLRGHELSPVKHLYLKSTALERSQKVEVLEKFVDKVSETGAAILLICNWIPQSTVQVTFMSQYNSIPFIHESSRYLSLFPILILLSPFCDHCSIFSSSTSTYPYIPTEIFYFGSKNAIFIIAIDIGWYQVITLFVFFSLFFSPSFLTLQCIERNLAISNATYLDWLEKTCPEPSLRVISNRLLTDEDMQFTFETIENISSELLSSI